MTGDGNHRCVVRTIFEGGDKGIPSFRTSHSSEGGPKPAISRYAAGDTQIGDAGLTGSTPQFVQQDRNDTSLDAGADIGQISADKSRILCCMILKEIEDSRFQAAKAEVQSRDLRLGKRESGRVPLPRIFVDQGAAWIGQAQQFRRFVEG